MKEFGVALFFYKGKEHLLKMEFWGALLKLIKGLLKFMKSQLKYYQDIAMC